MANWLETLKFWKPRREDSAAQATPKQTRTTPRTGAGLQYYFYPYGEPLAIATVYRCVQLLSDSVAGLHLQYLKLKNDRYQEDINSPLHYLLSVQPQPEMSIFDFWSMAVKLMLLEGNAYIYPRYVLGELTDLVLCSRNTVTHDALNGLYAVCDPYSGVYGTFKESEIIHLYLHSTDGRKGESVIEHARRTTTIATAGDEETANRFTNGGNVRGIISNDKSVTGFGEYQDEELEKTAVDVDSRFSHGEHIVSLPGQVDFKQISLSSTDMQFLESRKFTVREICRFFGVHPSFVFDDTSKRIFKFDRKGIYSLDLESMARYQKLTIESGIYTVNDWRRIENQPLVEGGDTVLVSTNLAALDSEKITQGASKNSSNDGKD